MYSIFKKKWVLFTLISLISTLILTGFVLLFSTNYSSLGIINALIFGGFMVFMFGWLLFVAGNGLFDIVTYGVKQFWLGVLGKRMKESYVDYHLNDKSFNSEIYVPMWIVGLIFIVIPWVTFYLL